MKVFGQTLRCPCCDSFYFRDLTDDKKDNKTKVQCTKCKRIFKRKIGTATLTEA